MPEPVLIRTVGFGRPWLCPSLAVVANAAVGDGWWFEARCCACGYKLILQLRPDALPVVSDDNHKVEMTVRGDGPAP